MGLELNLLTLIDRLSYEISRGLADALQLTLLAVINKIGPHRVKYNNIV